ncbi:hypothetical protein, partial [Leptospira santarosai]
PEEPHMISMIEYLFVLKQEIRSSTLMDLTNEKWTILKPLMIEPNLREYGKGSPRSDHVLFILNGIL